MNFDQAFLFLDKAKLKHFVTRNKTEMTDKSKLTFIIFLF
jgi:hypothetical protein